MEFEKIKGGLGGGVRGVHSAKLILIKMTSQALSDNTHFRTQAFICLLSLELVPFIPFQISLLQINASVDLLDISQCHDEEEVWMCGHHDEKRMTLMMIGLKETGGSSEVYTMARQDT